MLLSWKAKGSRTLASPAASWAHLCLKMAIDLYSVLGIESNASQKDVIRAYRLRAVQLHPDKVHRKPCLFLTQMRAANVVGFRINVLQKRTEEERAVATADFQALQAAYDVLRHPKKRAHYDATGGKVDFVFFFNFLTRHLLSRCGGFAGRYIFAMER